MREECPSLEREQHTQCTTGEDQGGLPFSPSSSRQRGSRREEFPGAVREGERETERERCSAMRKRGERDHGHD